MPDVTYLPRRCDCFLLKTVAKHITHLKTVLALLQDAVILLKLKKCFFFQPRVDYLGLVAEPGRLSVAQQVDFRHTLAQSCSFLGACKVYWCFVKDFSENARPLTNMAREDALPNFTKLTTSRCEVSDTPKQQLKSPPVSAIPKSGPPYTLVCDASAYQLGCALLQEQLDGTLRPVGYWPHCLHDTEQNNHATERECYAVV